jgi:predicted amidohydrolase
MSTAQVSLLQVKTDDSESPQARYQRVIDQLSAIAEGSDGKKPDLIILPEFWHGGAFNIEQSVSLATTFPGPISDDICDIASTHGVWIHAGSFVENINGSLFNTSLLVDGQGHIAATYKKIHLFGFSEGESRREALCGTPDRGNRREAADHQGPPRVGADRARRGARQRHAS